MDVQWPITYKYARGGRRNERHTWCAAGAAALRQGQCAETVRLLNESGLGWQLLFRKGNHDTADPGAEKAFKGVLLPYLLEAPDQELKTATYTVERDDTLFAYFDACNRESPTWLERTLERHSVKRLTFVIHTPMVPLGARATRQISARLAPGHWGLGLPVSRTVKFPSR